MRNHTLVVGALAFAIHRIDMKGDAYSYEGKMWMRYFLLTLQLSLLNKTLDAFWYVYKAPQSGRDVDYHSEALDFLFQELNIKTVDELKLLID